MHARTHTHTHTYTQAHTHRDILFGLDNCRLLISERGVLKLLANSQSDKILNDLVCSLGVDEAGLFFVIVIS